MNESNLNRMIREHKARIIWFLVFLILAVFVTALVFGTLKRSVQAQTYTKRVFACSYAQEGAEPVAHQHNDDCYENGELICTLPERELHIHGDECYTEEKVLVCTLEEGEGHVHTDACYTEKPVLICTLEENDGHVHSVENGCYTRVQGDLICTDEDPEHVHTDECYAWEEVLTCEIPEGEGAHHHSEECYETQLVLSCGKEEGEGAHTHDDTCYEINKVLICDKEEVKTEHVHTVDCFQVTDMSPEEIHALHMSELPESDPDADVESPDVWESRFASVPLSGHWDRDLLKIAETQLGYTESQRNFEAVPDEYGDGYTLKGWTRYGAWYGIPYGDWCAMFISFCMNYADIPESAIPYDCATTTWIDSLSARGMYAPAGSYDPKPGDLIFFDWEGDGLSDHVGIVWAVNPGSITTIEGNHTISVELFDYDLSDGHIQGYGILPENPALDVTSSDENLATEQEDAHGDDGESAAGTSEASVNSSINSNDSDPQVSEPPVNMPPFSYSERVAGMRVSIEADEGAFPEGTTVTIKPIEDDGLAEQVAPAISGQVVKVQAVDITFYDADGNEIEPRIPIRVTMRPFTETEADNVGVVHVDSDGVVSAVDTQNDVAQPDQGIAFSADSFSTYALVYTVTFACDADGNVYQYSMPGGTGLSLRELLIDLGMKTESNVDSYLSHVVNVAFSKPDCMTLTKEGNDWRLQSVHAFDTPESLTVAFDDFSMLAIPVSVSGIEELQLENASISSADGVFLPEGTEGYANVVEDTAESISAVEDYVEKNKPKPTLFQQLFSSNSKAEENNEKAYQVFDIGLENIDSGSFTDGFNVEVKLPENVVGKDFHLYHIHDNNVEEIDLTLASTKVGTGSDFVTGFSFQTDSFSTFALSYTVDFAYVDEAGNAHTWSFPGTGSHALTEVLEQLGIEAKEITVADLVRTETVGEFGEKDLYLTHNEETAEWFINSDAAFDDTYKLTVVADEKVYEITVTDYADSAGNKNYTLTVNLSSASTVDLSDYYIGCRYKNAYYSKVEKIVTNQFSYTFNINNLYVNVGDNLELLLVTPKTVGGAVEDYMVKADNKESLINEYGDGSTLPNGSLVNIQMPVASPSGDTNATINIGNVGPVDYTASINFYEAWSDTPDSSVNLEPAVTLTATAGTDVYTTSITGTTSNISFTKEGETGSFSAINTAENITWTLNGTPLTEGTSVTIGDYVFSAPTRSGTNYVFEARKPGICTASITVDSNSNLTDDDYYIVATKDSTDVGYYKISETADPITFTSFAGGTVPVDKDTTFRVVKLETNAAVSAEAFAAATDKAAHSGARIGENRYTWALDDVTHKYAFSVDPARPVKYQVKVLFDEATAMPESEKIYLYVEAQHATSGTDKFGGLVASATPVTELTYVLYDSNNNPASGWTQNKGGMFTGNEDVEYTLYFLKQGSTLQVDQINITTVSEIEEGGYVYGNTVSYTKQRTIEKIGEQDVITDYVVMTRIPTDSEYNFRTILGNGLYFGITANQLTQANDLQTNFACNTFIHEDHSVTPNLSGASSGTFYIGEVTNSEVRINSAGNDTTCTIYVGEESKNQITPGSHVIVVPTTKVNIANIVNPILTHGKAVSDDMANHAPTMDIVVPQGAQRFELDTRAFPDDATIYIDGDYLARTDVLATGGGLKIWKHENQVVVFNFNSTKEVSTNEYYINGVLSATQTSQGQDGTANTGSDRLARGVVWNMNTPGGKFNAGTMLGIVLAPNNGTVEIAHGIGSSGAGWIIANTVKNWGGEWHNIYADMPAVNKAIINAKKTVNNRNAKGREKFLFKLERYNTEKQWEVVESNVQNHGSAIEFTNVDVNDAEHDCWTIYRITETAVDKSTERAEAYTITDKVFYAAVYSDYVEAQTGQGTRGNVIYPTQYYESFDKDAYAATIGAEGYVPNKDSAPGVSKPISATTVPVFNNLYNTYGEDGLVATKILEGRDLKEGEFTFTLKGSAFTQKGKIDVNKTVRNDATGKVHFGELKFALNATQEQLNNGYYELSVGDFDEYNKFTMKLILAEDTTNLPDSVQAMTAAKELTVTVTRDEVDNPTENEVLDVTISPENSELKFINKYLPFEFSKVWMLNGVEQAWPDDDDLRIGVTIGRKIGQKPDDSFTPLTYTNITKPSNGQEFGTNEQPKLKATVTDVDGKPHYKFSLSGLEPGKWEDDGTYTEYTYYVKETTVPSMYSASYLTSEGEPNVNGESATNGGSIVNTSVASYELPETGGPGTALYGLIGGLMVVAAGAVLTLRKKKNKA